MAKGYWIGRVDVHNEDGYKAYAAANPAIFKKFGGRFVVRAGKFEAPKAAPGSRNVVIEFPDYATALACYRSPEYQANIKVRQPHWSSISSSSKATTGRSRKACAGRISPLAALYPAHGRARMAAANSDMRVVIAGAGGRMGRTLIHAVAATKGLVLAGAVDAPDSAVIGRDAGELAGLGANGIKVTSDVAPLLKEADGLIEFTIPAATLAFAELTAAAGKVHIIGTTGHSAEQEAVIAQAAKRATIVKSGNMSLGVNLLAALVKRVAKTLNDDYDIEIVEMHHNKKIDAPSGTALMLGRAAAEGRGIDLAQHSVRGRDGMTGARRPGDIGFASLRGGTVVGDHSAIFAGPAERIELTHRAEDRMIFARGALHAALWARGRKPGLYSMADVLGLKDI